MSTEIEHRVVEMRFDNKQFESGTRTTMSTLDKLNEKLNLKGAVDGFKNINNGVKNVDMHPLVSAAETVSLKFSAMDVIAVTALSNITNSVINTGKRML